MKGDRALLRDVVNRALDGADVLPLDADFAKARQLDRRRSDRLRFD
jgi:hypothetical protein